jgi:hypothetical protein
MKVAGNRRIAGWSFAVTLHTQLVLDALNKLLMMGRPKGVIHHSDQGWRCWSARNWKFSMPSSAMRVSTVRFEKDCERLACFMGSSVRYTASCVRKQGGA